MMKKPAMRAMRKPSKKQSEPSAACRALIRHGSTPSYHSDSEPSTPKSPATICTGGPSLSKYAPKYPRPKQGPEHTPEQVEIANMAGVAVGDIDWEQPVVVMNVG